MGKFRVRVSAKGKRWKKGQSSNSNPSSTKFRSAAKTGFFQPLPGESQLTKEALKQHDKHSFSNEVPSTPEPDAISFGGQTYKTFDTFASDWSQCTNKSFSQLINRFKPNNAFHKELLAVLAAITEVIKENGGSESSTEYFGALMTALESQENDESSIKAVLTLLSMGIKGVPPAVLQVKFPDASKAFMQLLATYANADHPAPILRPILGCISVLLRNQEIATWNDSSTLKVLDSILAFITFSQPKVRKAAQHGVTVIVLQSKISNAGKALIADHCIKLVEGISTGGVTSALHALTMLKDIMHTFPKKSLKKCCESILKVMTMNNVLVTSCGLQALYGMLSIGPSAHDFPPQRNSQLINALYDYQPPPTDCQPTQAWLLTLKQAFINLSKNENQMALSAIGKLVKTFTSLYLTEKVETMSATTHALDEIVEQIFSGVDSPSSQHLSVALAMSSHLTDCLAYQYHASWSHILHLHGTLYKNCNQQYQNALLPSLKTLGSMRDSNQFALNNEIDSAVSCAISSLGPEVVLNAIPFQISPDDGKRDFKRSWLLPILKDNIKISTLKFFIDYFLPQAVMCRKEAERLKDSNDQIGSLSYDLLQSQIWSLLPSFSNSPSDITASFPVIAKALGGVLSTKHDLRMSVLTSLRRMILVATGDKGSQSDTRTLARFAKNYLPILFGIYTTPAKGTDEEGARLATLETIKVYLKITERPASKELFEKAFSKLFEPDVDNTKRTAVLDLLRALLPYQNATELDKLFKILIENINITSDHRQQKKYFRLIEELCTAESEVCQQFTLDNLETIKETLLKSLSTSAPSSRGARLRCILEMIKRSPDFSEILQSVLPEAILCVKDINSKCRETAFKLVTEAAERSEDPEPIIHLVMMGLTGSQNLAACSILALAPLIYHYRDNIKKELEEQMLYNIRLLAISSSREIVSAAMSFFKVYIQTYSRIKISTFVPYLMKLFSEMSDDTKRSCRTKIRDMLARLVRWYGGEFIMNAIPSSDQVLKTRVRNLSKILARRKRSKEALYNEGHDKMDTDEFSMPAKHKTIDEILAESDSDLEFEEEDGKPHKKSKEGKAWITEAPDEIIDFTDISTAKKISTTNPETKMPSSNVLIKKKPKNDFKTAPDGRIIITDGRDDSDEDDAPKKKKKSIIPGLDDSDDDVDDYMASDDEGKSMSSMPVTGKRKRTQSMSTSASTVATSKYVAGGSGIHRPVNKVLEAQKKKTKKGENKGPIAQLGTQYKSKKVRGDVKRKDLPDPYAYIPLRRDALNKRKRMKAIGQFKNLVKSARKGVAVGLKRKAKKR